MVRETRGWNFRRLLVLIFSGTLFLYTHVEAQNAELVVYQSYIEGNFRAWLPAIEKIQQQVVRDDSTNMQLLNYYYGYTAWLVSEDYDDEAEQYIDIANQLINKLLKISSVRATAYAYRGAFYGFEIGKTPYKAMSLGPKSNEAIAKSLEFDPNNIQAYIEKGNAAYYTPALFGGSKTTAVKAYKKAVSLMEARGLTHNNWLYINTLTMLAQACQRSDNSELAKSTYQKILKLEPDFVWVRDDLYPEFLEEF